MFTRQEAESEAEGESCDDASDSGAAQPPAADDGGAEKHAAGRREEFNEHETIIGIDQDSDPEPLRHSLDQTAATAQAGAREHARRIAVDMQDIAKHVVKSESKAVLEKLVAAQGKNEEREPLEALAVPSGDALSTLL